MHPRSPYAKAQPDFAALAKAHPKFAKYVNIRKDGTATIDFQEPNAVRALTETLLLADFGIVAEQAGNRLCPTIPNRLNYVLWLQDLIAETRRVLALVRQSSSSCMGSTSDDSSSERPKKRARLDADTSGQSNAGILGLDIGTGASAIYPLLMCATDPTAEMIGTDIDEESLAHAKQILRHPANQPVHKLASRIKTMLKRQEDPFFYSQDEVGGDTIHFIMCNPPFYASKEEMKESATSKASGPSAVCTGTDREMIYSPPASDGKEASEGGEVGFVGRMIEESLRNLGPRLAAGSSAGPQIWWYTSMLGRLSSVDALLHILKKKADALPQSTSGSPSSTARPSLTWIVHELVQGNTKRWVLAWSFLGVQIPPSPETDEQQLARHRRTWLLKKALLRQLDPADTIGRTHDRLLRILAAISDVEVMYGQGSSDEAGEHSPLEPTRHFDVVVRSISWTRAARRARERASANELASTPVTSGDAALIVHVSICNGSMEASTENAGKAVSVDVRWKYGHSRAMFDSFCQHLRSKWKL